MCCYNLATYFLAETSFSYCSLEAGVHRMNELETVALVAVIAMTTSIVSYK